MNSRSHLLQETGSYEVTGRAKKNAFLFRPTEHNIENMRESSVPIDILVWALRVFLFHAHTQ